MIRALLRPVYRRFVLPHVLEFRRAQEAKAWVRAGRKGPPPALVKQRTIRSLAKRFGTRQFVETGTYMGWTVEAVRGSFQRVLSIELEPTLAKNAQEKFAADPGITILQGDSAERIADILSDLREPALFWLDGHYSAGVTARGAEDSPIVAELDHIARHPLAKQHVILIDDAREFVGANGYPPLDTIRDWAERTGLHYAGVQDDMILIHPRS